MTAKYVTSLKVTIELQFVFFETEFEIFLSRLTGYLHTL